VLARPNLKIEIGKWPWQGKISLDGRVLLCRRLEIVCDAHAREATQIRLEITGDAFEDFAIEAEEFDARVTMVPAKEVA